MPPAEGKVETREQFTEVKKAGFVYFSGILLHSAGTHEGQRSARQWPELHAPAAGDCTTRDQHRDLESLIKHEASVCYRLLRYLNSAAFGIRNESALHSACHHHAGRARSAEMDPPGRDPHRRREHSQRAGKHRDDPGAILPVAGGPGSARRLSAQKETR